MHRIRNIVTAVFFLLASPCMHAATLHFTFSGTFDHCEGCELDVLPTLDGSLFSGEMSIPAVGEVRLVKDWLGVYTFSPATAQVSLQTNTTSFNFENAAEVYAHVYDDAGWPEFVDPSDTDLRQDQFSIRVRVGDFNFIFAFIERGSVGTPVTVLEDFTIPSIAQLERMTASLVLYHFLPGTDLVEDYIGAPDPFGSDPFLVNISLIDEPPHMVPIPAPLSLILASVLQIYMVRRVL